VTTIDDVVRRATEVTFDKCLVTNVFRSVLVEAIVAAALPDWNWCSSDYASWDFRHRDSTRLEVKQSAARQTWFAGRASPALWDIRPRTGYWGKNGWVARRGRYAHIYILAHHPVLSKRADHRDARQWRFYVVATSALPDTKSISEARAARLTQPVTFEELASHVEALRIFIRKQKAMKGAGRSRGNSRQASRAAA
jgi:hypothetical protein